MLWGGCAIRTCMRGCGRLAQVEQLDVDMLGVIGPSRSLALAAPVS